MQRKKVKKKMTIKPFKETLYNELQYDSFAAAYLEDALTDSIEEFLVALRHIVKARSGGIAQAAEDADVTREATYRMLSEKGNPAFRSVQKMLNAAGLKFSIDIAATDAREPVNA